MRIFIVILSFALCGCAGQSEMGRIVNQMQHSYAEGRKAEFEQKADEILTHVKTRNLEYLIANTGPAAKNELGEDGLQKYYRKKIFSHLSNGFEFEPNSVPQVTFDEADNVGYEFLYEVASDNCEGVFKIVVISYSEKKQIRGMSFKNFSTSGTGTII